MPAHQHFEELCALAVTGQITGEAMATLDAHVKQCASCRSFLQDVGPFKAHVAPVIAASHVRDLAPPEGARERFLARAVAAGLDLKPGAALVFEMPSPPAPVAFPRTHRPVLAEWRGSLRYAAAAAACVLCGLAGYLLSQQRAQTSLPPVAPPPATARVLPPGLPAAAPATDDRRAGQARIAALSLELERAQAERQQLGTELARLTERAAAGELSSRQLQEQAQKLADAEQQVQSLQATVDAERKKAVVADAVLIAQQRATQDALNRMASLQSELDRQRETHLDAGDFSHLIAARNLHIIDVYDTAADGARQRPFGRVFYVEGRSLVFYAYDLPSSAKDVKISFRVWGETAGTRSVSYSLGALRSDDQGQRRWVLACDDPRVLARINAVYVTAEPAGRPMREPSGRKLMYAFLGAPNHP